MKLNNIFVFGTAASKKFVWIKVLSVYLVARFLCHNNGQNIIKFRSSIQLIIWDWALCFRYHLWQRIKWPIEAKFVYVSCEPRITFHIASVTGLWNANRNHHRTLVILALTVCLYWVWYVASIFMAKTHWQIHSRASAMVCSEKRTSHLLNIFVIWMDVDTLALDLFGQLVHDSQEIFFCILKHVYPMFTQRPSDTMMM